MEREISLQYKDVTAVTLGLTFSWDVVLCSMQVSSTLMKEAAGSYEKLVHIYQTSVISHKMVIIHKFLCPCMNVQMHL
jgi:hypothetical protein